MPEAIKQFVILMFQGLQIKVLIIVGMASKINNELISCKEKNPFSD
jgi:hypothetical protein